MGSESAAPADKVHPNVVRVIEAAGQQVVEPLGVTAGPDGAELLIWGGENCAGSACPFDQAPHLADGAAYNVLNDAWRKLPASPLSAREAAATVWTGSELLIWGGTSGQGLLADGAAYDPAAK